MSEPKDHHFSPIFYLKSWCNSDEKLIEYSRPYQKVITNPEFPQNTGFERNLYTLHGVPNEKKQLIEKDYMSKAVDNNAAIALKILINRDQQKLTDKVRSDWTRFIMACW